MLKSNTTQVWQSLENYRKTMIATNIFLGVLCLLLILALSLRKPFYVIYVDEKGSSKLLIDNKTFNEPRFIEIKNFSQDFIVAYMGLDSNLVSQRLAIAQAMMTNELLDQHKTQYSNEDIINSVKSLSITTNIVFESTKLKKTEANLYYIEISGIAYSGHLNEKPDLIKYTDEKRFISRLTLMFSDRTKTNPSGLRIHNFEYKMYKPTGEEVKP